MLIRHVDLLTNDLAETELFYGQVLRFPITGSSAHHRSFAVGHSALTFWLTHESQPFYHLAFGIPGNQLETAHAWLSTRTSILPFSATSWRANFDNWNAQAFYFHDPTGNILEFITRLNAMPSSSEPFDENQILGINEVGLPVDSLVRERERLYTRYQIPYFVKGPQLDDISAMGDENGLLILVKTDRGWLPTQRPAEKHPLGVSLVTNDFKLVRLQWGYETMVEPQFSAV